MNQETFRSSRWMKKVQSDFDIEMGGLLGGPIQDLFRSERIQVVRGASGENCDVCQQTPFFLQALGERADSQVGYLLHVCNWHAWQIDKNREDFVSEVIKETFQPKRLWRFWRMVVLAYGMSLVGGVLLIRWAGLLLGGE